MRLCTNVTVKSPRMPLNIMGLACMERLSTLVVYWHSSCVESAGKVLRRGQWVARADCSERGTDDAFFGFYQRGALSRDGPVIQRLFPQKNRPVAGVRRCAHLDCAIGGDIPVSGCGRGTG